MSAMRALPTLAEARAKSADRLKKFDALAKDKNLDEKIVDEGRKLLARMPR